MSTLIVCKCEINTTNCERFEFLILHYIVLTLVSSAHVCNQKGQLLKSTMSIVFICTSQKGPNPVLEYMLQIVYYIGVKMCKCVFLKTSEICCRGGTLVLLLSFHSKLHLLIQNDTPMNFQLEYEINCLKISIEGTESKRPSLFYPWTVLLVGTL